MCFKKARTHFILILIQVEIDIKYQILIIKFVDSFNDYFESIRENVSDHSKYYSKSN